MWDMGNRAEFALAIVHFDENRSFQPVFEPVGIQRCFDPNQLDTPTNSAISPS
jgi:hypothetical protein